MRFHLPENNRTIYALWLFCLTLIGIAASLKMTENIPQSVETLLGTRPTRSALRTDSSFYSPSMIGENVGIPLSKITPTDMAKSGPSGPVVTAQAYLVGNVETGTVYLEHNSRQTLPVASMSKLVTAFAATDILPSTTTIEITPEELNVPPDGSNLKAGEKYSLDELLYPLLLNSSNVAAEALASTTDRKNFLKLLSSYAWEIGMPSSYFADPSGLSPNNKANARDVFALARYLYHYRPDILAITRTVASTTATTTDHGAHVYTNIHPFVGDGAFIGGKTGHTTEAGDTMLTILRIKGQPVAFIVLHSRDGMRAPDTTILRDQIMKVI